jgi:transposase
MPRPCSQDLRQRVVDVYLAGGRSYREVGEQFSVGDSTVVRWVKLFRETGSVAAKPARGGQPSKLEDGGLEAVQILVLEKPDIIEREITGALARLHRIQVSRSSVNRALHRLGLSRKKRASRRPSGKVSGSSNSDGNSKKGSRRST